MLRRRLALAVALVLAAGGCTRGALEPRPGPTRTATRPNLVVIVTDDQWAGSLEVMPNVRRLIGEFGVTFRNAFVTTSLCCPSRASILTGRYARHHGVLDVTGPDGGAAAFDDSSTLARWLRDAGYRTSLAGRYMNGYGRLDEGYVPPGWDDWHALAGAVEGNPTGYVLSENGAERQYSGSARADFTEVITDRAIEFLRAPDARPFFLYLAPLAPHPPALPHPRDRGRFVDRPIPIPPSFNEADVSDKPWAEDHPLLTEEQAAELLRLQRRALESLIGVDRAVGRLVAALAGAGHLEDTVIVFTSDNGFMWGEHRLAGKVWPYEPSIRVPLLVRGPGFAPGETDALVANVDLPATLLDLAGVRAGLPQDGSSLVPLLRGRDVPWRGAVLLEYAGHRHGGFLPESFEAVRTEEHLYVEYADGGRELYDLTADPDQLQNLAGFSSVADLEAALAERLRALTG